MAGRRVDLLHRPADKQPDFVAAVPVPGVDGRVAGPDLAGQHRGQKRPPVRRMRLIADHRDVQTGLGGDKFGGDPPTGRASADDYDPHAGTSRRAAHTLNSGMPEVGSSAGLVTVLARPLPGQWKGMNKVSGRIAVLTRAGAVAAPRRVTTRTGRPSVTSS